MSMELFYFDIYKYLIGIKCDYLEIIVIKTYFHTIFLRLF